jgi:N-acetylglucosamine-6-phosphate deacetylase
MQRSEVVINRPISKDLRRFCAVAKRVIVAVTPAPEKASRTAFLASANFNQSLTFWKIVDKKAG